MSSPFTGGLQRRCCAPAFVEREHDHARSRLLPELRRPDYLSGQQCGRFDHNVDHVMTNAPNNVNRRHRRRPSASLFQRLFFLDSRPRGAAHRLNSPLRLFALVRRLDVRGDYIIVDLPWKFSSGLNLSHSSPVSRVCLFFSCCCSTHPPPRPRSLQSQCRADGHPATLGSWLGAPLM